MEIQAGLKKIDLIIDNNLSYSNDVVYSDQRRLK